MAQLPDAITPCFQTPASRDDAKALSETPCSAARMAKRRWTSSGTRTWNPRSRIVFPQATYFDLRFPAPAAARPRVMDVHRMDTLAGSRVIGADVPLYLRHARPLLAGVTSWSLPAGQWAEVDDVLTALASAVDTDDVEAAGRELARLVQCAPETRVKRTLDPEIGEPRRAGPDESTRAIINHLVHSLVAEKPPEPPSTTGHDGHS